MDISKPIKVLILMSCIAAIIIPLVKADGTNEYFNVYTDKTTYEVGGPITVYVQAGLIDPGQNITITDVVVYDPNGLAIAQWHNLAMVLTNTATPALVGTLTATIEGTYTIDANATGCAYRLYSFCHFFCQCRIPKSVPEIPFGTIAAMATGFGATGLYITKKRRKNS